jgi:hypothetical protein
VNNRILAAVAASLLATVVGTSQAAIIFDNTQGGASGSNGNEMTQWIQAEDFTLTAGSTLTGINFASVDSGLFDGTIVWQIYSDVAGAPGAILFSGTATPTRTTGAAVSFGTEHSNSFTIAPATLAAGTYFLGLHNGTLTDSTRSEFYWETIADTNTTPFGIENITPFGDNTFSSNGQEHDFQLIGTAATDGGTVPEPESTALFGLGAMAALVAIRRRRAS